MPLPPLPDPAVIDGPGHISDSQELTNYLRALAQQDEVEVSLPDPAPGKAGHIEWHNAMVSAAKKVAAAIGAKVTLPPETVKAKDLEHVTHHNLLAKALADMSAAVPFSVDGGKVWTGSGWKAHIFANDGLLTVKGKGTVTAVVCGGGAGSGYFQSLGTFSAWFAGPGGGGSVYGVREGSDPPPTVELATGTYQATVGKAGGKSTSPDAPGANGGNSTLVGGSVSITAPGGGGGGSGNVNAQSFGTGGGGGAYYDAEPDGAGTRSRVTQGAAGNPGGDGVTPRMNGALPQPSGSGGAGGSAYYSGQAGQGGSGWYSPAWLANALASVSSLDPEQLGSGAVVQQVGWGSGGNTYYAGTVAANPGVIVVAYPNSELLRAGNR